MSKIYLLSGDVTKIVRVDALITLINPEGDWYGGVDFAITKVAGNQYHDQAEQVLKTSGLENGQVIVVKLKKTHPGNFAHIIFVVDDYETSPLSALVFAGLCAAKDQGYESVALPLMRTGVMLGKVESTIEATLDQMILGIEKFKRLKSKLVINVVVYKDPQSFLYLMNNLT